MKITLITEGTYPHNLGGVSVWCDQLLRAMTEHSFELLAISSTGAERNIWELPGNVARLRHRSPCGPRRPGPGLALHCVGALPPVLELFLQQPHGREPR